GSFLLYCLRDHCVLLSFPTRRPSDLWRTSSTPRRTSWTPGGTTTGSPCSSPAPASRCPPPTGRASRSSRPGRSNRASQSSYLQRSEEHTSELQSRENLVCRLLLEKKN